MMIYFLTFVFREYSRASQNKCKERRLVECNYIFWFANFKCHSTQISLGTCVWLCVREKVKYLELWIKRNRTEMSRQCTMNNNGNRATCVCIIVLLPSNRWSMLNQEDRPFRTECALCTSIQWKVFCVIWRVPANTRLTIVWRHGIRTIKFQGLLINFFHFRFFSTFPTVFVPIAGFVLDYL